MIGSPAIGQHLIEMRIIGMQTYEEFTEVGPWLNPMAFGPGQDGKQNGRAMPGLLVAKKQPILPADGRVP